MPPLTVDGVKKRFKKLSRILALPNQTRVIEAAEVNSRLLTLTHNIHIDVAEKIKRIGSSLIHASQSEAPSKKIYYLKGSPGTGKTFLAKGLADALNLPFLETKITGTDHMGTTKWLKNWTLF